MNSYERRSVLSVIGRMRPEISDKERQQTASGVGDDVDEDVERIDSFTDPIVRID